MGQLVIACGGCMRTHVKRLLVVCPCEIFSIDFHYLDSMINAVINQYGA